jgi:hypothetical protein
MSLLIWPFFLFYFPKLMFDKFQQGESATSITKPSSQSAENFPTCKGEENYCILVSESLNCHISEALLNKRTIFHYKKS